MENNFVPYEQANDLKQLGFDGRCSRMYHDQNEIMNPDDEVFFFMNSMWDDSRFVASPTYKQAFFWINHSLKLTHKLDAHTQNEKGINSVIINITEWAQTEFEKTISSKPHLYKNEDLTELKCIKILIEEAKKIKAHE